MAKGFKDVNGGLTSALVLPESGVANFAMQQILQNGLFQKQEQLRRQQFNQQLAQDYNSNRLKVTPGVRFNDELNKYAQDWYNQGVAYRKQGFNVFQPNYQDPRQVEANRRYLADKSVIDDMIGLRGKLDEDYKAKHKDYIDGKIENFDEYNNSLSQNDAGNRLYELYKSGGMEKLPQVYSPLDYNDIDKTLHLAPQERQVISPNADGTNTVTQEKYIEARPYLRNYEQVATTNPAFNRKLAREYGISSPKDLYTFGDRNVHYDPKNPEDTGVVDEPGIYAQLKHDYLTNPTKIVDLPESVKNDIKAGKDISKSADFNDFIDKRFTKQLQAEKGYREELIKGLERKATGVTTGSSSKLDDTSVRLALAKDNNRRSWASLAIAQENSEREKAKYKEHLADKDTRAAWVNDIQDMKPDAVRTFTAALREIGAKTKAINGGIVIDVPYSEKVPATTPDGKPSVLGGTVDKKGNVRYTIGKFSGRSGRVFIEQLLNKLPTIGKKEALKTEPYAPTYDNLGDARNTADDL